jgi:CBS domain-containing protein
MDNEIKNLVVEVVHKIRPEGTVLEALQTMLEKDVGCLVVSGVGGPSAWSPRRTSSER